jgi:hypothetical protein
MLKKKKEEEKASSGVGNVEEEEEKVPMVNRVVNKVRCFPFLKQGRPRGWIAAKFISIIATRQARTGARICSHD